MGLHIFTAYESFGLLYGDLSVSPLYIFRSTRFQQNDEEIFGILAVMIYTITILFFVKYVLIVLNDKGEGGRFHPLSCRNAKSSLFSNPQQSGKGSKETFLKPFFEKHRLLRVGLLMVVLLSTCIVISNRVFTPAISVPPAVSGIRDTDHHEYIVNVIACIILVGLFGLQHFGHKVGSIFAPIVIAWLFCISAIGIYNIAYWNPGILRALSPYYMYTLLKKTGAEGWISFGGVVLCIAGTNAMFADLDQFSSPSIKLTFVFVVYPCLALAYMGQAAYLSKNHTDIQRSFFKSIPEHVCWPVSVIATLAMVVGNHAMMTSIFSLFKQCLFLGCLEVKCMLIILWLALTLGFHETILIGVALITMMFVTTFLMSLVMVIVWRKKKNMFISIISSIFFGSIELFCTCSSMIKFSEGGWIPLVLAVIFMAVMYTWHHDLHNKVSMKWRLTLGPRLGIVRVPGIELIYTELVTGIPAIFSHFVTNIPASHQVLVFVCIKSVPVPYVPLEKRYLIGRIDPREYRMYRCIVRYGYKDVHKHDYDFENQLIMSIREFIRGEGSRTLGTSRNEPSLEGRMAVSGTCGNPTTRLVEGRTAVVSTSGMRLVITEPDDSEQHSPNIVISGAVSDLGLQDSAGADFPEQIRKNRVTFEMPKTVIDSSVKWILRLRKS